MINPVVVATGSKGNCVIYDKVIVDLGVSFKKCHPYINACKYLFLTHEHGDHFNKSALLKINDHRPDILIIAPEFLENKIKETGLRNVYYIRPDVEYELSGIVFKAHELSHDVPNVGYSIFFLQSDDTYYKVFHATDTYSLDGIEAKGYDLYAIEFNHDEELIQKDIDRKRILGQYAHEINAIYNHHSFQRAEAWIQDQANERSQLLKLHLSSAYLMDEQGVITKVPVEQTIPNEED